MTKDDLLSSLGTIARSGTAKFAEVRSSLKYLLVHSNHHFQAVQLWNCCYLKHKCEFNSVL